MLAKQCIVKLIKNNRRHKHLNQILKWLCNIKHNVSKAILFETLDLDGKGISKPNINKTSIIKNLTTKVIKLRTGWLFNRHNKLSWDWEHPKTTIETINKWAKLESWRRIWTEDFLKENIRLENALLKLKCSKSNYNEITRIVDLINDATEDMIKAYFKKS